MRRRSPLPPPLWARCSLQSDAPQGTGTLSAPSPRGKVDADAASTSPSTHLDISDRCTSTLCKGERAEAKARDRLAYARPPLQRVDVHRRMSTTSTTTTNSTHTHHYQQTRSSTVHRLKPFTAQVPTGLLHNPVGLRVLRCGRLRQTASGGAVFWTEHSARAHACRTPC